MPCYHPINAWQVRPGIKPQFTPAEIKLQLSCGQCIGCRLERSRQWAVRCIHEASQHNENCFITLTYDEDRIPYGGSLVKPHFQKFMKKLRRRIEPKKVRFFMAGEYGDELGRPHFHAILFGHEFKDKQFWTHREGIDLFISDELEDCWGHGFCTVGDATWETAAYISRYVIKKRNGDQAKEHYSRIVESTGELIQIEPEYGTMSLRPAIGKEWFDAYKRDCFPKDFTTHKGRKYRVPKYYDELLKREDEKTYQEIKEERKRKASQWAYDNTSDRLRS